MDDTSYPMMNEKIVVVQMKSVRTKRSQIRRDPCGQFGRMQCLDGLKENQQMMILMLLFVKVWMNPTISVDHCYYPENTRYKLDSSDDKVLDDYPCCPPVIARNRASLEKAKNL
jgi:hypothetical protein